MKPNSPENYIIEVTQEQLDDLRQIHKYLDDDGYVEMHYSPYWKETKS